MYIRSYTYIYIHTYRDVTALDELIEEEELDLNQKISDTMGGHIYVCIYIHTYTYIQGRKCIG